MPEGAEANERGDQAAQAPHADPSSIAEGKAFISYASQNAAIANALCDALESARISCWLAPRDVRPGDFYADAIVQALATCRVLVLVLSQAAIDSPHVMRELERASSKRLPIIAFRTDAAPLTPGLEYFLSASQWLDASGGPADRQFPKLIEAMRGRATSAPHAESGPSTVGTQPSVAPAVFTPPPYSIAVLPFVNMAAPSAAVRCAKYWAIVCMHTEDEFMLKEMSAFALRTPLFIAVALQQSVEAIHRRRHRPGQALALARLYLGTPAASQGRNCHFVKPRQANRRSAFLRRPL